MSFNKLAGSTIEWYDNSFYASGTPGYNGITPGPGGIGVDAMVLKSSSTAVNFALKSMKLYDWGGTSPLRVAAYDNGTLVGTTDVSFDQLGWTIASVSFNQTYFGNIDEVRFYASPSVGSAPIYLTMNAISLAAPPSTLPVIFSNFDVQEESATSVKLKWETANEQNADHFEIERSLDGIQFVKRGDVKAKGNTNSNSSYSFVDNANLEIKNLFRIKEVDANGRFSYSKVITVAENRRDKVEILPNPANGMVNVLSKETLKGVVLFNASGVLVKSMHANSNNTSIDISQLPAGVYYLQTLSSNTIQQHMLIVK